MIEDLVSTARARNIGEIHINVDEGEADTRRFYEARGFTNQENGQQMLCYLRVLGQVPGQE